MKVNIYLRKVSSQGEIPWVYIGHNSVELLKLEKKNIGKRIRLGQLISEESTRLRPEILEWINKQRLRNGDSIEWWSTNLGSKVNFTSNFFSSFYQISALNKWISINKDLYPEILVVCDRFSLGEAVYKNIRSLIHVNRQYCSFLESIKERGSNVIRHTKAAASQILKFFMHHQASRLSRPDNLTHPTGDIYILHQCLDDAVLADFGEINCRYFPGLPGWLEAKGKKVFRLPWLSNVTVPLPQLYKRLREHDVFIPNDWVGIYAYFDALWAVVKSIKCIDLKATMPGFDISDLMRMERSDHVHHGLYASQFWLLKKALQNFLRKVKSLVVIQFFELHPPEHFLISFSREVMDDRVIAIGYYHNLVTRDYLAYYFIDGNSTHIFPDIVVTNGSLAIKVLSDQGIPSSRLLVGPGLRNNISKEFIKEHKDNRNGLLVLLPIFIDAACEMLDAVGYLASWIQSTLSIPVFVKPHPMMKSEKIIELLGWKSLPENWSWEKGELASCLYKSKCAITVSSASIINIVLAECIPIPFSRELDVPSNYLDILGNQSIFSRSVGREDLKKRLEDVYLHKTQYFIKETIAAKITLQHGVSEISNELLTSFIPPDRKLD